MVARFRHPEMVLYALTYPERTHEEIGKRFGYAKSYVDTLSCREKWKEWQEKVTEKGLTEFASIVAEMKNDILRQMLNDSLMAARKAGEDLEGLEFRSAEGAIAGIEKAQNMIRQHIGETGPTVQLGGDVKLTFEVVRANGRDPESETD